METRRLRIATDENGKPYIQVAGTDIEVSHVTECTIFVKPRKVTAHIEIDDPEIDIEANVEVETTKRYKI